MSKDDFFRSRHFGQGMARYSRFKGWFLTEIFLVAIFVRATAEKSSVAAIHEMQGAKAFIGATLIDGIGAEPKPDAVIVVVDGQINRIGRTGEIDIPVGIPKIDVAGKWVIPGLIDAHVHFFQSASLYTRPDRRPLVSEQRKADGTDRSTTCGDASQTIDAGISSLRAMIEHGIVLTPELESARTRRLVIPLPMDPSIPVHASL